MFDARTTVAVDSKKVATNHLLQEVGRDRDRTSQETGGFWDEFLEADCRSAIPKDPKDYVDHGYRVQHPGCYHHQF